ncbi:hypothetical protein P691DRAFT_798462 [Macrolepiota fuliginosa MF-IS2]|uniref:Cytochrome b5 heme-binding domain-containing protein n=1 Tax=Macrolepiota fuliginosa MF-IS2 TaxID=1400762 RepID=A0A9P5XP89_9AGAR|nr:hypothetical protein P691DRAFT_798462 [Macrolepiota fuliginosa MF-IS2]
MNISKPEAKPWWSNIAFFVGVHLAAFVGAYYWPIYALPRATIWLAFASWQLSCFGITIGYHRLYSHKSFKASLGLRVVLAVLGTAAHQGSIRRFTDDPIHDPYAATRGLLYSHVGWIFFKPTYNKLHLIETDDLDKDPVVRIQHQYYHLLAMVVGFVFPTVAGFIWGDATGGFVWGGLVARILIWHCTFFVNSLAHWNGIQPYSDENTSRGNLHAFPHDFRSGPSPSDWDPSKWAILAFDYLGLATKLRRAKDKDILDGLVYMRLKEQGVTISEEKEDVPTWTQTQIGSYLSTGNRCVILLDGYIVDATTYLSEHPGGAKLVRSYSLKYETISNTDPNTWPDASVPFHGGMNIHSWAANQEAKKMRVAKIIC